MLALCWQCFLPLTFLVLVKTSVRSVLIIIPTFQMRKLRHRVVKSHAWDHTFRMWKIRIKIHENWYIAPYTPKKKKKSLWCWLFLSARVFSKQYNYFHFFQYSVNLRACYSHWMVTAFTGFSLGVLLGKKHCFGGRVWREGTGRGVSMGL